MTRRANRGFVVVAVLWIVAALAALLLTFRLSAVAGVVAIDAATSAVAQSALFDAATELAALQLRGQPVATRPALGTFTAAVGSGHVTVSFRTENARIDLNAAPRALLAGLFASLGAGAAEAADCAGRIVARRNAAGARPFALADELWSVAGLPQEIVSRTMPLVTTFTDTAAVNVVAAPAAVLAALPGMTPLRLQELLARRADTTRDPRDAVALAGDGATAAVAPVYRLAVVATQRGRSAAAEIVIAVTDDAPVPYGVLAFRLAADAEPGP